MALITDISRELNRVVLFTNPNNGLPIEPIFSAYTNSGLGVSYANDVKDFMGVFSKGLFKTNLGSLLGTSIFGVTGQIDVERKYLMNGTEPLKFDVDCYLVLNNNYEADIARPCEKLLNFILPQRGDEIIKDEVVGKISSWCSERADKLRGNGMVGENLWDKLQTIIDGGKQWLGKCYEIKPSRQIMHSGISRADEAAPSLSLVVGNQYFDGVFVNNVTISIPKLTAVDAMGGVPEFVNVKLSISTLRGATTAMVNFKRGTALGIKTAVRKAEVADVKTAVQSGVDFIANKL